MIYVREDHPPELALSPVGLINSAIATGASHETIVKLLEFQERNAREETVRAFNTAMAAAKAGIGPILKNQRATRGDKQWDFEDLAQVARAVDPVIGPLGLSYRYRASQGGKSVTLYCIISHEGGHFEETSLTGDVETSTDLSPIQALGFAATMLQRITLKLAFGLSAYRDNDCQRQTANGAMASSLASSGAITAAQIKELEDLAAQVGATMPRLCKFLKVENASDIPASRFTQAKKTLEARRAPK